MKISKREQEINEMLSLYKLKKTIGIVAGIIILSYIIYSVTLILIE